MTTRTSTALWPTMWAKTMSCSGTRRSPPASRSRSSCTSTRTSSRSRAIPRSIGRGATTTTSTARWSTTARTSAATATTGGRRSVWCTRGTITTRAIATPGGADTTVPVGTGVVSATTVITPTLRVMSILGGIPGGHVRAAMRVARPVVRADILVARRVDRSPARGLARGRRAVTRCARTAESRQSPPSHVQARARRVRGASSPVVSLEPDPRDVRRARAR